MRRAARPLLALAALLLSLAAAELAARALVFARTPKGMVFDPEIIYSYRPRAEVGGIVLNDVGCVGDDLAGSADADLRVLLLGGSTSFSQGYVDTVRARLRARLAGAEVAVMSCGKPRYTSATNRVILDRMLPRLRPTAVVLYLGINDNIYNTFPWVDSLPDVGYFDWRSPRESLLVRMVRYHLLEKRLWSRPGFGPGELRSVAILTDNVEAMVGAATAAGAQVVLCSFAVALPTDDPGLEARIRSQEPVMEHFWGHVDSTLLGVAAHNRAIAEIASRRGLPLAPVASLIPRDSRHFLDLCHLTAEGNRILGEAVADALAGSDPRSRQGAPAVAGGSAPTRVGGRR
ncbi:MAG: hypothetical protein C3F15_07600 [Holophagae bacterium]|nr:MAG: hypothetical protein C3F15_07600 [Holophagae bacterium]